MKIFFLVLKPSDGLKLIAVELLDQCRILTLFIC